MAEEYGNGDVDEIPQDILEEIGPVSDYTSDIAVSSSTTTGVVTYTATTLTNEFVTVVANGGAYDVTRLPSLSPLKITSVSIPNPSGSGIVTVNPGGDTRKIEITGKPKSTFTLTLEDSSGCSILQNPINNVVIPTRGSYGFTQVFPSSTTDTTYELNIMPTGRTVLGVGVPTTVPTITIYQYQDPTVTLTTTTKDHAEGETYPVTLPSSVTFSKPAYQVTQSLPKNPAETTLRNEMTVDWSIEKGNATTWFLYTTRQPNLDDLVVSTSFIKKVISDIDCSSDRIKTIGGTTAETLASNRTIDTTAFAVGMKFKGDSPIKKMLLASIGINDCNTSSDKLKLNNVLNLKPGMVITVGSITTTLVSIDNDNDITISSKETINDGIQLTFSNEVSGTITKVYANDDISIHPTQFINKNIDLTFDSDITNKSGRLSVTGSGSTTLTITGGLFINKMGKEDVTYTLDIDKFVTETPNAYDQSVSVTKDTAKDINVMLFDKDSNTANKTPSTVVSPIHGAISGSYGAGDGTITYTPNTEFTGNDYFTYKVNDGGNDSETKTISITVS